MPLSSLRKEIDKLDNDLIKLLKKRLKVVEKIAKVKKKHGLEIFDRKRENEIAKKLAQMSKKYKVNKIFLYKVWDVMMTEAKELQEKVKK